MPLEFIPNQPIIFAEPIGDYPCLNNDTKEYGQLLQDGDKLCIQWKLEPCNEPMCEPNMVSDPVGSDELGSWSADGGWSSASSSTVQFDGTANPGGTAEQTITGLTIGAVYFLTFEITAYTGLIKYDVNFGISQTVQLNNTGIYSFGFIAETSSMTLRFQPEAVTSNSGDTLLVQNLLLKQYTSCWLDDLNGGLSSWSYSFDGANGKFCSTDPSGGDLINTNAISAPGTYHGIELTISDCTQGGVIITLGGSTIPGQTSGNGTFRFYTVPTAGVDLIISKADNFDGCISQVSIFDYGDIDLYEVHFETDDGNTFSDDYSVIAFEDRIVWCDLLSNLTWTVDGVPDGALTCKLLKTFIYDPCTATEYESVNYINYKNDGWECTKLVESWNDGFAFGFYFGDIANPDFKLTQRLRVLAFNPVYRNAGEEYLYSSGNTGRSFAQSQKARTAWFDYMDEYAHDCTRTQLLGQKLFIDGYAFYYPTEDYEPEWNERGAYNLAQSRVTVFHEEAIFGSNCGTMANAVCPPQVIPSPVGSYNQIQMKGDFTNGGFDFTNCSFSANARDVNGNNITTPCAQGAYDLTNPVDRALALADIICFIDNVFSTSASGTLTYTAPSTLAIDITGSISMPSPAPVLSIAFYDTLAIYPDSFATIPS